MKKIFFIIFFCVFLLVSNVLSYDWANKLEIYSNFSVNDIYAYDSSGNNRNGSVTSANWVNGGVGTSDGYFCYDGDAYISYDNYGGLDNYDGIGFTYFFWVNSSADTDYMTLISEGCSGDDDCIFALRGNGDSDGIPEWYVKQADATVFISGQEIGSAIMNDTWNFIVITKPPLSTPIKVYVNTELVYTSADFDINPLNFNRMTLGALRRLGTVHYLNNGCIDEFGLIAEVLNQTEIDELSAIYNVGCNPFNVNVDCNVTLSPTLTLYSNLTNGTINFNQPILSFNYSGVFTNNNIDIVNISFYINSILNTTLMNINLSDQNIFNITINDNYENYLNISFNASNYEVSANSEIYIYNIDVGIPQITANITNNSQFTQFSKVNIVVNYTDKNLFATNTTIYDDNYLVYNSMTFFYTNLTGNIFQNLTILYNALDLGTYHIKFDVWDSHTTKQINDYEVNKLNDGLQFENEIYIYSTGIKNTYYEKQKDRYIFSFEYANKSNWHDIYIQSTGNLIYINDEYKGHFIDFINKKWIDLENENINIFEVEKINNNLYRIRINDDSKTKILNFNSIGDLNYNSEIYNYNIVSQSSTTSVNLTKVENDLNEIKGGIIMLPFILLIGIFFFGGIMLKQFWLWCISALTFIIMGWKYTDLLQTSDTQFNLWISIIFITFGFIFFIGSIAFHIVYMINEKNKNKSNFYADY